MNRLQMYSLIALVLVPALFLILSFTMRSAGFFFYALPGAVAPGLTGYLISHFGKQKK